MSRSRTGSICGATPADAEKGSPTLPLQTKQLGRIGHEVALGALDHCAGWEREPLAAVSCRLAALARTQYVCTLSLSPRRRTSGPIFRPFFSTKRKPGPVGWFSPCKHVNGFPPAMLAKTAAIHGQPASQQRSGPMYWNRQFHDRCKSLTDCRFLFLFFSLYQNNYISRSDALSRRRSVCACVRIATTRSIHAGECSVALLVDGSVLAY